MAFKMSGNVSVCVLNRYTHTSEIVIADFARFVVLALFALTNNSYSSMK